MFNRNKYPKERIEEALGIAWGYGQIEGEEQKAWVIDRMVRALLGNQSAYEKWIFAYEAPIGNDEYYEWDVGIRPQRNFDTEM